MLPFMMSHLGENLYGLWVLIGGFTATLHLFDFGFASAVTRFVARAIEKKDIENANTIISSSLVVYTGLSVMVFIFTLAIAFVSHIWVEDPKNILLVRNLIIITGLTLAISFPFKAFAGISKAYLRYDLESISRVTIKLLSTGATIYLLLAGYELLAIAIVGLISSVISNIAFFSIAKYLFRYMRVGRRFVEWQTIKNLSGYSGWAFASDMTRLLHQKLDIFMVGAYLGTATLAIYYVAIRLVEYTLQLLGRATGITTPLFTASHARGDMDDLRQKTMIFVRINLLLGGFSVYYFFLLGDTLIQLWMGEDFEFRTAYITLCIIISGKILLYIMGPLASALMAISRHHWLAYLSTAEVVLSAIIIFLSLTLTNTGLIGVALGISCPFLITRVFILALIMKKEIGLLKRNLATGLITPIILIAIAWLLASTTLEFLDIENSLLGLLISSTIVFFAYWGLTLFSLTHSEWGYLIKILPNKLSRLLPRRFLAKVKIAN